MGKQNLITFQLLAISGILMSILVSMFAFRHFSLPEGQADLSTEVDLTVPYIRLVSSEKQVENGKTFVSVEVVANTGGAVSTGADTVITYDPSIMRIEKEWVENGGAFANAQVNTIDAGKVDFSVFSQSTRNEEMLSTNADQEIVIAKLKFEVINPTVTLSQLDLLFSPDTLTDTNLILLEDPRPETPTDILKAVQGTIISL
jgi:hypothetical protein